VTIEALNPIDWMVVKHMIIDKLSLTRQYLDLMDGMQFEKI
jgi:hypothetical protein